MPRGTRPAAPTFRDRLAANRAAMRAGLTAQQLREQRRAALVSVWVLVGFVVVIVVGLVTR